MKFDDNKWWDNQHRTEKNDPDLFVQFTIAQITNTVNWAQIHPNWE